MLHEVSNHPPHLIDSSGSLTPSGLIPFCAYQTSMTLLGQTRQDLPFTVCSGFKPFILQGQLCYSLDLSTIKIDTAKTGMKHGLVLILDEGRSKNHQKTEKFTKKAITSLNFETSSHSESSARIYLNTLASFTGYRAGSYALSVLKKMTGTDNFLGLPFKDKKCRIETFEECQIPRYIEEVNRQCGCIPWALNKTLPQKVIY